MLSAFMDTEYTTKRLLKTYGKSVYIDSSSGIGHLRPASDEMTRLNDLQFGELFEFFIEGDADAEASDRITIGGELYTIKGMKREGFGGIDFKRLLLVKVKA